MTQEEALQGFKAAWEEYEKWDKLLELVIRYQRWHLVARVIREKDNAARIRLNWYEAVYHPWKGEL